MPTRSSPLDSLYHRGVLSDLKGAVTDSGFWRDIAGGARDVVTGVPAGVLGAPGDIESLIRMLPYLDDDPVLPTTDDIQPLVPFTRPESERNPYAAMAGQFVGGAYMGPGSPLRAAAAVPGALKHGAREFVRSIGTTPSYVIKPKGGNWLSGSVEESMRSGDDVSLPRITQIKGKGNAKPKADYIPFVQDFVRSQGPWSEIKDFYNTDFVRLSDPEFMSEDPAHLQMLRDKFGEYVTKDEIINTPLVQGGPIDIDRIVDDALNNVDPPQYAGGGLVDIDAILDEAGL